MIHLPSFEIIELNKEILGSDNFNNDVIVASAEGSHFPSENPDDLYTSPLRINAVMFILVLQGTAKVGIDFTLHTLMNPSLLMIMPTHTIQVYSRSEDFKAKLLILSQNFLDECSSIKTPPSATLYMQLRKNPYVLLEPEEAVLLNDYMKLFINKIRLKNHHFQLEVLRNTFIGFTLELGNIFVDKESIHKQPVLTRKEEMFQHFLELLLTHSKSEHGVNFYAEKLCITPQYLSLILKELTGKSASKWIDEALLMEAKVLLKTPNSTIQQVADMLNFSDQSTFGKFFKKYMGISPMEYRKS